MTTEREQLFGTDLQLIPRTSDVDLRRQVNGDYALAEGNDNIIQALTLRLRVREGELAPLGWPRFGSRLHELIGQLNNTRTRAILMAHARTALERDPRVLEITEMSAVLAERSVVRLIITLLLINSPTPLNLVFDQSLEVA
jgi:phage baseplate assembly protein W